MTTAEQGALESSWPGRSGPVEWPGLPYAFFMPAFILVVLISFFPLAFAIKESFFEIDYLGRGEYVGLENYTRLFMLDGGLAIIWQSLVFVFGSLLVTMPLGIGLALLLNGPIPFRAAFRVLLIVPWLVSSLVTALLWTWALAGDFSPLSGPLATLGLRMPMVVTNPTFAMPALILANAWHQYPMVMVFVLAALQTIPQELVEASRIDGATAWQHFRLVTMPLISNTILVSVILTAMHTFNNASIVFIMTGGGPLGLTETLATRVFIEGFKLFRTGPASAIAVLCFAANVALALTFIRVLRAPREAP